jgi:hypothetical protein
MVALYDMDEIGKVQEESKTTSMDIPFKMSLPAVLNLHSLIESKFSPLPDGDEWIP